MPSIPRRRFLATALCAPVVLAGCVDDVTPTSTRYATAMKRVVDLYGIPGALASVRVPGEDEWRQALGYADLAARTPSDFAGHFAIRSVTKSFTVTLVLQLVRDGTLALDSRLSRYIPGIPNGDAITIADMAGNQSGLADYSRSPAFLTAFVADLQRTFTEQELVDYASAVAEVRPGRSVRLLEHQHRAARDDRAAGHRAHARAGPGTPGVRTARPLADELPLRGAAALAESYALRR